MSIGKRLIDLARSELNSLLDKAARVEDDDDRRSGRSGDGDVGSMSDEELEAEIERRRQAREEVERATSRGRASRPTPGASRPTASGRDGRGFREEYASPRRTAAGDEAIRRAYAALEIPAGSDFEAVKRSYRRLMRKYHPDLNAGSVERQKAATDLTQRLTEAYKTLEKHLRK